MVADDLRDLEKTYPPDWVEFAFREAVNSNARNLKYIRAILTRIQTHGFDNKPGGKPERKGRNNYAGHQQSQPVAQQDYSAADRELAARIKAQREHGIAV
jgi:DNA replication protein DnaD